MPFLRKFFPRFLDRYDPEPIPDEEEYKLWYVPKTVQPVIDMKEEVFSRRKFFGKATESVTETSPAGYYAEISLDYDKLYELYGVIAWVNQGNATINRIVYMVPTGEPMNNYLRLTENTGSEGAGVLLWDTFPGGLKLFHSSTKYYDETVSGTVIDWTFKHQIAVYMNTPPGAGLTDSITLQVWGIVYG